MLTGYYGATVITSPSNSVTLHFVTNAYDTNRGWDLTWSSKLFKQLSVPGLMKWLYNK